MIQAGRTLFLTSFATLLLVAPSHGQDQRGGPGAPQVGPVAGARGGPGFAALPTPPPPKPLIPNAKPVRSCNNSGICRVSAFTTHAPTGDKVKIWIGIPMANWNGRFMGTGSVRSAPVDAML